MRPANIYLIEKDWELLIPFIEKEKTISVKNDITLYRYGKSSQCIAISVSEKSDAIINMVDAILLQKNNSMVYFFLKEPGDLLYGDKVNLGFIEL
jgi:hypothetical protein